MVGLRGWEIKGFLLIGIGWQIRQRLKKNFFDFYSSKFQAFNNIRMANWSNRFASIGSKSVEF